MGSKTFHAHDAAYFVSRFIDSQIFIKENKTQDEFSSVIVVHK